MNEQQFLQNYSQDRYDRPSIATDIAAFSLRTVKSDAYRASPELKLCVLLVRRGGHPFKDHWALPGGFLQRGESIDECAFREDSKDYWHLQLRNRETVLSAKLLAAPSATAKTRFAILENEGLAFDHASILASAMDTLRREGEKMETVFAFLPEKFTLFALQKVQETLLGITLLTANFRRKIADFVEETDEYTEGAGHRPARLFRKKL